MVCLGVPLGLSFLLAHRINSQICFGLVEGFFNVSSLKLIATIMSEMVKSRHGSTTDLYMWVSINGSTPKMDGL